MNTARIGCQVRESEDRLEFNGRVLVVGESPSFRHVVEDLRVAAPYSVGVLVEGESGTGKETLCHLLHAWSPRADRPFLPVNCAALPDELFESEVFGHRRGAYTHAYAERAGLLSEACGGTLFLDELSSLSLRQQPKLLRFLDSGEYRRVGDDRSRHAEVRMVSASNRPVQQEVAAGRFRADLFFRLNTVSIHVPPLRRRREDIPMLTEHLVSSCARELRVEPPRFSARAISDLRRHDWPGNIRELRNVLIGLILRSPGQCVSRVRIPRPAPVAASQPPAGVERCTVKPFQQAKQEAISRFEFAYLEELLDEHRGNVSRAARAAGKHRRALHALLNKHGIDADRYRL